MTVTLAQQAASLANRSQFELRDITAGYGRTTVLRNV